MSGQSVTSIPPQYKSAAGRKKISYSVEELERQPLIEVVCGMKGVGKTYGTIIEIDNYVRNKPYRKGRKALILDFNNEKDYYKYATVLPEYVGRLTEQRARRVIPIKPNGKPYSPEDMKKVAEYCCTRFKNGLLVLEDPDKYLYGKQGSSIIGMLTTNRHSGLDVIIAHQSIGKISTTEWQNCAFLRLHHQLDPVENYADRITNFPLVKIAQIVVDKKYYEAVRLFKDERAISEKEFKKRRSFNVFINMLEGKIIGCTIEDFREAAIEFIKTNPKFISRQMLIGDSKGKKLSREGAIHELLKKYMVFHDGRAKE